MTIRLIEIPASLGIPCDECREEGRQVGASHATVEEGPHSSQILEAQCDVHFVIQEIEDGVYDYR